LIRFAYLKPVLLGLSIGAAILLINPLVNSWLSLILYVGLFELIYIPMSFLTGIFADTEKRALLAIWQAALGWAHIKRER
jgi:hypothetical protein